MASINKELFQKLKKAAKLSKRQEADGNETQVEVREDEEQSTKLEEIIDLLVAAGYFRARIKGLSSFDKVVGGMTWCIESLNVDVDIDVDLLFQENSTIGEKIALTEKIVAVLPKIKCPHRVEPHQIQGLDFIHVFPVIQWLVKASMSARQEKSAFVRSYAINQFNKEFPTKNKDQEQYEKMLANLKVVDEVYRPHRFFKRKNAPPPDILSKVQITLLEYGYRGGVTSNRQPSAKNKDSQAKHEDSKNAEEEEEEQKNIEQLLDNLTAAKEEVLQDEHLSEEDKQNLVKHYETLYFELKDGGAQSKEDQKLALLQEQSRLLDENIAKLNTRNRELEENLANEKRLLEETRQKQSEANKALKEFEDEEKNSPSAVREVEQLVLKHESLKSQEAQFKENCKQDLAKLQREIGELKKAQTRTELTPEQKEELEVLQEKTKKVRLALAKKNQIVAKLQRQLDDIPNRAEMAQYQRRFLELYNQVAAKHKETKQYYTLYNTLEDKRRYMQKELSLLNSVADSYPEAVQSARGKEEFLKQFRNILEGVRQNRLKIEKQVAEEKKKRDQLGNMLQNLHELQRAYATAVRQLSLECRRYEVLLAGKS